MVSATVRFISFRLNLLCENYRTICANQSRPAQYIRSHRRRTNHNPFKTVALFCFGAHSIADKHNCPSIDKLMLFRETCVYHTLFLTLYLPYTHTHTLLVTQCDWTMDTHTHTRGHEHKAIIFMEINMVLLLKMLVMKVLNRNRNTPLELLQGYKLIEMNGN